MAHDLKVALGDMSRTYREVGGLHEADGQAVIDATMDRASARLAGGGSGDVLHRLDRTLKHMGVPSPFDPRFDTWLAGTKGSQQGYLLTRVRDEVSHASDMFQAYAHGNGFELPHDPSYAQGGLSRLHDAISQLEVLRS